MKSTKLSLVVLLAALATGAYVFAQNITGTTAARAAGTHFPFQLGNVDEGLFPDSGNIEGALLFGTDAGAVYYFKADAGWIIFPTATTATQIPTAWSHAEFAIADVVGTVAGWSNLALECGGAASANTVWDPFTKWYYANALSGTAATFCAGIGTTTTAMSRDSRGCVQQSTLIQYDAGTDGRYWLPFVSVANFTTQGETNVPLTSMCGIRWAPGTANGGYGPDTTFMLCSSDGTADAGCTAFPAGATPTAAVANWTTKLCFTTDSCDGTVTPDTAFPSGGPGTAYTATRTTLLPQPEILGSPHWRVTVVTQGADGLTFYNHAATLFNPGTPSPNTILP